MAAGATADTHHAGPTRPGLAVLPEAGELTPGRDEHAKLALLEPILMYHERVQVFEIKLIDVPQAVVALYQRAVILISRPALRLVSGAELQALVPHEIGHEYFWADFERTLERGDKLGRQELELKCDGIAVLTPSVWAATPPGSSPAFAKCCGSMRRSGRSRMPTSIPGCRTASGW